MHTIVPSYHVVRAVRVHIRIWIISRNRRPVHRVDVVYVRTRLLARHFVTGVACYRSLLPARRRSRRSSGSGLLRSHSGRVLGLTVARLTRPELLRGRRAVAVARPELQRCLRRGRRAVAHEHRVAIRIHERSNSCTACVEVDVLRATRPHLLCARLRVVHRPSRGTASCCRGAAARPTRLGLRDDCAGAHPLSATIGSCAAFAERLAFGAVGEPLSCRRCAAVSSRVTSSYTSRLLARLVTAFGDEGVLERLHRRLQEAASVLRAVHASTSALFRRRTETSTSALFRRLRLCLGRRARVPFDWSASCHRSHTCFL